MRQAALPGRAWEAGFDRLDDPGRTIADHQKRIAETAGAHVLKEGRHGLAVFFGTGHQMQEDLAAIQGEAPGRQHRLPLLAGTQSLGDAVDEQIGDLVFAEIPALEDLIVLPELLAHLGHRRLGQQEAAALVPKGILDIAHRQTACQHLDRQAFQSFRLTLQMLPDRRAIRLVQARNLRRRVGHVAFGGLQPTGSRAVAVALARNRTVLVIVAAERVLGLALQRFLDDQPGRQFDQRRTTGRRCQPSFDQG